jgi:hypothetical protein
VDQAQPCRSSRSGGVARWKPASLVLTYFCTVPGHLTATHLLVAWQPRSSLRSKNFPDGAWSTLLAVILPDGGGISWPNRATLGAALGQESAAIRSEHWPHTALTGIRNRWRRRFTAGRQMSYKGRCRNSAPGPTKRSVWLKFQSQRMMQKATLLQRLKRKCVARFSWQIRQRPKILEPIDVALSTTWRPLGFCVNFGVGLRLPASSTVPSSYPRVQARHRRFLRLRSCWRVLPRAIGTIHTHHGRTLPRAARSGRRCLVEQRRGLVRRTGLTFRRPAAAGGRLFLRSAHTCIFTVSTATADSEPLICWSTSLCFQLASVFDAPPQSGELPLAVVGTRRPNPCVSPVHPP